MPALNRKLDIQTINAWQTVYAPDSGNSAVVNVNLTNRNSSHPIVFQLAISFSGTPRGSDNILYKETIHHYSSRELRGVIIGDGQTLLVQSDTADVSINIWGYTEILDGLGIPPAATPIFNLGSGFFTSPQTISITDATAGATIYYTLDGSTPTIFSLVYNGSFVVSHTTTVKAFAIGNEHSASGIASATYSIRAATPVFSPDSGVYAIGQTFTLTDATAGAIIHYTTDGSTPTSASPVYSGPVTVNSTETVKAIAIGGGFSASLVAANTYTIQAATPTFSPIAGGYPVPFTVAILDSSAGVTIYYTTDGSTPTISSAIYVSPITISDATTVKAIASGGAFTSSLVGSAIYASGAATPTFDPPAGTYIIG